MIEKKDLRHGAYYRGRCRNGDVARWNGAREVFVYWRSKFGETFAEEISHPDDARGFDPFVPSAEIVPEPERKIPLEV